MTYGIKVQKTIPSKEKSNGKTNYKIYNLPKFGITSITLTDHPIHQTYTTDLFTTQQKQTNILTTVVETKITFPQTVITVT